MRFICLHGIGTSSALFKVQTAALRYELGDGHVYEFVQGTLLWPMAPELTDISKADNPHYAYTDPDSAESYLTALDQLEAYISRDGGFDGILAFSQGAGLAIQYMARKRIEGTRPLKCAILFAPTGVGDVFAWNERREKRLLKQLPNGEKIGVPVALIWGAQDEWRDMFEKDMQLFEEKNLWGFEHEGGHEIPGLNMKTSFRGVVKVVRRAITQAVLESG